jgi:hypothetical protein
MMVMTTQQILTIFLIETIVPCLFLFGFLYPFYKRKKAAGKLDPNKSFLENLWDSILP